jgi:uncharacterized membrane protein
MNKSIRRITYGAIAAAIIFVATWVFKIPIPGTQGYVNLGDSMIYFSAGLLGPYAAAAAAIGSAIADLAGGSVVYIPATIIVKGLMGLVVGLVIKKGSFAPYAVACIIAGAIMTVGYALFELLVFGFAYTVTAIPYNLAQWGVNVIVAIALYPVVIRTQKVIRINDL